MLFTVATQKHMLRERFLLMFQRDTIKSSLCLFPASAGYRKTGAVMYKESVFGCVPCKKTDSDYLGTLKMKKGSKNRKHSLKPLRLIKHIHYAS